jgi:hypothetical protein
VQFNLIIQRFLKKSSPGPTSQFLQIYAPYRHKTATNLLGCEHLISQHLGFVTDEENHSRFFSLRVMGLSIIEYGMSGTLIKLPGA